MNTTSLSLTKALLPRWILITLLFLPYTSYADEKIELWETAGILVGVVEACKDESDDANMLYENIVIDLESAAEKKDQFLTFTRKRIGTKSEFESSELKCNELDFYKVALELMNTLEKIAQLEE